MLASTLLSGSVMDDQNPFEQAMARVAAMERDYDIQMHGILALLELGRVEAGKEAIRKYLARRAQQLHLN